MKIIEMMFYGVTTKGVLHTFIESYSNFPITFFYYTFLWLIFQIEEEIFFRYYPPAESLDEDVCAGFLTMLK